MCPWSQVGLVSDKFSTHYVPPISWFTNPYHIYICWLVVSTPLKNISQIGSSSQLLGKIKNVPNHQPVYMSSQFNIYAIIPIIRLAINHLR